MNDVKLVSIVIPIYKTAVFINKCITSILAQRYPNFELILVDDGSPDRSGQICDEYARKDKRIRSFHIPNGGVSNARNVGIQQASGQFIVFIDSDDWVRPDHLSTLLSVASKGGLGTCEIIRNTENNAIDTYTLNKQQAMISVLSAKGIGGFPVNKIYDREVIEKYHLRFDRRFVMCEDLLFNLQYLHFMPNDRINCSRNQTYYYETTIGAVKGRYQKNHQYSKSDLSEYEAVLEARKYCTNIEIQKAWNARLTKAAVNSLRALVAGKHTNCTEYKNLLFFVRQSCVVALISSTLAKTSKISILFSAISPKLEYKLYLRQNNK